MSYVNYSKFTKVAPARVGQRAVAGRSVMVRTAHAAELCDKPMAATLADLSIYGCRLVLNEPLDNGAQIHISIDGSRWIAAQSIWQTGGKIGCRFEDVQDREWVRRLMLYSEA